MLRLLEKDPDVMLGIGDLIQTKDDLYIVVKETLDNSVMIVSLMTNSVVANVSHMEAVIGYIEGTLDTRVIKVIKDKSYMIQEI